METDERIFSHFTCHDNRESISHLRHLQKQHFIFSASTSTSSSHNKRAWGGYWGAFCNGVWRNQNDLREAWSPLRCRRGVAIWRKNRVDGWEIYEDAGRDVSREREIDRDERKKCSVIWGNGLYRSDLYRKEVRKSVTLQSKTYAVIIINGVN